jgi:hypothetical protein
MPDTELAMNHKLPTTILFSILSALGTIGGAPQIHAGTVITSNLPPNTAIININGTQDGAASFNGDQSLWYQPFSTSGVTNLLRYTVQPGTYSFRVVDPADAAQLFPALTTNQLGQIYTAWTFNSPWLTDYLVFDSSAATNSSVAQLFDGAFSNTNGTWTFYSDAATAYNAAITDGFYNLIRTGSEGRDGLVFATNYTFASTETLIFAVPDYGLGDNAGGVSVLIAPSTPRVPLLTIALVNTNSVVVSWPDIGSNTLQQNTMLAGGIWTTNTSPVTTLTGTNSITITPPTGDLFFRLSSP